MTTHAAKPTSPRLDRGHPKAARLLAGWLLQDFNVLPDLAGNYAPGTFTAAGSFVWGVGPYGRQLDKTAGGAQRAQVYAGAILAGRANWTALALVRTTTTAIATGRAIYCERAAGGNDILKLDSLDSTTAGFFLTYRNDGGTLLQLRPSSPPTLNDGAWHVVGVTKSGTAFTLYQDGTPIASGTYSSSDTFTDAGLTSSIGGDPQDASGGLVGSYGMVLLYSDCKPAAWMATHAAPTGDPFAFARPRSRAGIFLAPSAQSIASPAAAVLVAARGPAASATGTASRAIPTAVVAVVASVPSASAAGVATSPLASAVVLVGAEAPGRSAVGTAAASLPSAVVLVGAAPPPASAGGRSAAALAVATVLVAASAPGASGAGTAARPLATAPVLVAAAPRGASASGTAPAALGSAVVVVSASSPDGSVGEAAALAGPGPDPRRGTVILVGPDPRRGTATRTGPDPRRSTAKKV